jgi:hypothetical protein
MTHNLNTRMVVCTVSHIVKDQGLETILWSTHVPFLTCLGFTSENKREAVYKKSDNSIAI